MFITLLLVTVLAALLVSFLAAKLFSKPIDSILFRIVNDNISSAWGKFIRFAIIILGVSEGVKIWELENYISDSGYSQALTTEKWILHLYRTVIESLQSIAILLMIFFVFSLIAYSIVRIMEHNKKFHHHPNISEKTSE